MGQGIENPPEITINNNKLEVVNKFTYLDSILSDYLSLDIKINRRIGRAASTFASLIKIVWGNGKLTIHNKVAIYRAWVLSTLWQRVLESKLQTGKEA